jgi:hypothetical protein
MKASARLFGPCLVAVVAACNGTMVTTPSDGGALPDGASCQIGCPIWTVRCGDECVDLTANPQHCGACFAACDARSQACQGGVCGAAIARCTVLGGSAPDGGAPLGPNGEFPPSSGLRGEYYGTQDLTTLLMVRTDGKIDFDWTKDPPAPGLPLEHYSVRWTGKVTPRFSESYTFTTTTDDGARLWIDGQQLVDDWNPHGPTDNHGTLDLVAGKAYDLRFEYFQATLGAVARLSWQSAHEALGVIPATQLAPAAAIGPDYSCNGGSCCAVGGGLPACCPAGAACVHNARFSGCCPAGQKCGESVCSAQ